jgi:hypothetical protein
MTNFDFWKANLTPEVFASRWEKEKETVIFLCAECPARERCIEIRENLAGYCLDIFLKWAREEHG